MKPKRYIEKRLTGGRGSRVGDRGGPGWRHGAGARLGPASRRLRRSGGGTLRVRSPGALTTVVGTLFAVEAMGLGSRVAVAHGRVRTEDLSGGSAQVSAGSGWTSADD